MKKRFKQNFYSLLKFITIWIQFMGRRLRGLLLVMIRWWMFRKVLWVMWVEYGIMGIKSHRYLFRESLQKLKKFRTDNSICNVNSKVKLNQTFCHSLRLMNNLWQNKCNVENRLMIVRIISNLNQINLQSNNVMLNKTQTFLLSMRGSKFHNKKTF